MILKKILSFLFNIIIIFVLFTLIVYSFSKYVLKSEVPNVFGFSILKVISGSMEPTIKIDDYIIIQKRNDYKIGDIITYKDKNDNLVTHRIIEMGTVVITKGDNNNVQDEAINKDMIKGKVLLIIPNYFKNINTIYIILLLFILFIVGCIITAFIPDKKRS